MDITTNIRHKKFKSNIYFIDFIVDDLVYNNNSISHYYTMQEYQCYYTKYSTQTTSFSCKDSNGIAHKFVIPYHIKLADKKSIRIFFLKSDQIVYKKPVILSIVDLDSKEELTVFEYDSFYHHIDVIKMFSIYNVPNYTLYLFGLSILSSIIMFFYYKFNFLSFSPILFSLIVFSFYLSFDFYGNKKIWNKTKDTVLNFIKNNT